MIQWFIFLGDGSRVKTNNTGPEPCQKHIALDSVAEPWSASGSGSSYRWLSANLISLYASKQASQSDSLSEFFLHFVMIFLPDD